MKNSTNIYIILTVYQIRQTTREFTVWGRGLRE